MRFSGLFWYVTKWLETHIEWGVPMLKGLHLYILYILTPYDSKICFCLCFCYAFVLVAWLLYAFGDKSFGCWFVLNFVLLQLQLCSMSCTRNLFKKYFTEIYVDQSTIHMIENCKTLLQLLQYILTLSIISGKNVLQYDFRFNKVLNQFKFQTINFKAHLALTSVFRSMVNLTI